MFNQVKTVVLLLLLNLLLGCSATVKHLDSTWADDKTVYEKSQLLPPLEIPPELRENPQVSHSLPEKRERVPASPLLSPTSDGDEDSPIL
ncbi:MAG TPA: hypothetical protein ENI48_06560 [Thioploca sp.]|nr:hypothetical protein [Thioploca sp.]